MVVCARDRIIPVKLAAELALVYVLQLLESETILQVCGFKKLCSFEFKFKLNFILTTCIITYI